jgi:lysophospholipase L1-like esterase
VKKFMIFIMIIILMATFSIPTYAEIELFNKTTITRGGYINNYGVFTLYTNYNTGGASDYMPVNYGEYVVYTNEASAGAMPYAGAWYDENYNFISYINGTGRLEVTENVPLTAKYLRINYATAMIDVATCKSYVTDGTSPPIDKLKINIMGDSVTVGYGLANQGTERFSYLLEQALGYEVRNYGVSGTLITKQDGYPLSFVERFDNMDDDADLIIVFGGINDFGVGTGNMGEPDSTNIEEFNGALNVLIEGLQNKYLGKEIVFITPYNLVWGGLNSDLPNTAGYTLKDYRNAIIERSEYHGIPVLDLYSMSGMDIAHNPNHRALYAPDGVHLSAEGHKRIADRIIGFLKTLNSQ